MTQDELGLLYPVVLKPYNPLWKNCFLEEKAFLQTLFSGNLRIEHIGSTAVEGLSAKPTIDILMERPDAITVTDIIDTFTKNGYIYMKDQTCHLMFVKGYTPSGLEDISFHIHMGPLTQNWLWDRIFFRDYLKHNRECRAEYQELKELMAKKYRNDREAYTDSKADFISRITSRAKSDKH
ncbi:GrpB family protein [Marispirochaeta aestuarii]|uniref:GrpB family protein n=1 Tax=Marispirochaeta aestuarii TaxID=1963862 RepID=UPI0029C859F3|nr:GrpB family protein [Marispirochaeta aestuarii]